MSIASRLAKWTMFRRRWAGHSAPVQRIATPSSSRTMGEPHSGQRSGRRKGTAPSGRLDFTTSNTSGMISPALRTSTVSPMRTSSLSMKSWLCSVAFVTVVPARRTGSMTALGVSTPVRPTCTAMSRTTLSFTSGGYL